jgi:hypothetical protein
MSSLSEPHDYVGSLRAGRTIFGRYQLRKQLGRGGMGVVWLAEDSKLERPVALKFLGEALFLDAASRDDLKRETRRSLDLTHPNIVRIYDFLEDEEAAAISMEYVDGADLSSLRVARPQRCFETQGLSIWLTDLCRALDYAHHSSLVVHRDLKPSNLLIGAGGTLKVVDFGISCSLQNTAARVSAWSSTGGTLGYMSPQQLRGDLASPSDDIYSLGATLYELLTSKPPFYSGDISLQIRTVEPESMTARREQLGLPGETIPAHWEEAVSACLAKNPAQRPASAVELAERLGLDLTPTRQSSVAPEMMTMVARPRAEADSPVAGWSRFIPRHRWPWGAGIAAILLLTFVATFALRRPAAPAAAAVVSAAAPVSAPVEPIVAGPPGGLMIKTEPPGATVSVSGKSVVTPGTIDGLPVGAAVVRVELENYEPEIVPAQIRSHEFANLGTVTLRRSTGTLELLSEPQNAAYTLLAKNGNTVIRQGHTPDSVTPLPTGEYRVRLEMAGWPADEQTIQIERQSTRRLQRQFGEGSLQVTSDPPGATILLGERAFGVTPLTFKLPSGAQGPFTAQLDGWEPASFDATVPANSVTTLPPIVLRPQPPKLEVSTEPPGIPFRLFTGAVEAPDAQPTRSGETPAILDQLEPGHYRIVFDAEPWPSRSSALDVADRGTTRFHQAFPHGTVKIESQPPGAEIFFGEDSLGETPLEIPLPAGTHQLTAELNDRTSKPRSVVVKEDEQQTVRFDFRTSNDNSTRSRQRRRIKKPAEESALTKIGRSLKTFFTGEKQKR